MEKMKSHVFGKDVYLLGTKDCIKYWLEAGSWDCGWYWGLGYVKTYQGNRLPSLARDIDSHQHFSGLFFNKNKNGFDAFNDFFDDTTINNSELWKLLELMKTAYTCKEYAEVVYRGGSHYTGNPCKDIVKNEAEYSRINKIVIPALLKEVYALLSPENEVNTNV